MAAASTSAKTKASAETDAAQNRQPNLGEEEIRLIAAGISSLGEVGIGDTAASATAIAHLSDRSGGSSFGGVGARLRSLHLGGNRLASVVGLQTSCPVLERLNLSSNELAGLEGLAGLRHLRLLDITGNRLSSLEGLDGLDALEELAAAHNRVADLTGLLPLRGRQSRVRRLDLRGNALEDIGEVLLLGGLDSLKELLFQNKDGSGANAICRCLGYRDGVMRAAAEAEVLDEVVVTEDQRSFAWSQGSFPTAASSSSKTKTSPALSLPRWPRLRSDHCEALAALEPTRNEVGASASSGADGTGDGVGMPGKQVREAAFDDEEDALSAQVDRLMDLSQALQHAANRQPPTAQAGGSVAQDSAGVGGSSEHLLHSALAEIRRMRLDREGIRGAVDGHAASGSGDGAHGAAFADRVVSTRLLGELRVVAAEARRRGEVQEEVERELKSAQEKIRQNEKEAAAFEAQASSQRLACAAASAQLSGLSTEHALASSAARRAGARAAALAEVGGREREEAEEVLQRLRCENELLASTRRECAAAGETEQVLATEQREAEEALASGGAAMETARAALRELARRRSQCLGSAEALGARAAREAEEEAASSEAWRSAQSEAQRAAAAHELAQQQAAAITDAAEIRRRLAAKSLAQAESELLSARRRHGTVVAMRLVEARAVESRSARQLAALGAEVAAFTAAAAEAQRMADTACGELVAEQERAQDTRAEVELLESRLATAHASSSAAAGNFSVAEAAQKTAAQRLELVEAEQTSTQEALMQEERNRARDFVDRAAHESAEEQVARLSAEEADLSSELEALSASAEEVAASLRAEPETGPLRAELAATEARAAALGEELRAAERTMDVAIRDIEDRKGSEAALREEHAAREAKWKHAETEANLQCKQAKEQEAAHVRAEDDLREEMHRLTDMADAKDDDLGELLEQVAAFDTARSERGAEEEEELNELREAGLRSAEEAAEHLEALDARLGAELKRRGAELEALRRAADEALGEVAAYEGEEAAMASAWRAERGRHMQDAASLLSHFQGLDGHASGSGDATPSVGIG